jgi:putative transcriptional regulator
LEVLVREVRRLREELGWTQAELAYHAGLAPSVISEIETGKRDPGAGTLKKLASGLGVAVPKLFERSDPLKVEPPLPFNDAEQRGEQEQRRSAEDQTWEALAALFADLGADPREIEKLKAVRGTVREELPDVSEELFQKLFWSEALFHLQIFSGLLSAEEVNSPERQAVSEALHEELQMLEGVADIDHAVEHWQSE